MELVTLAEVKERLSIDFDSKDGEITGIVNAAEGYLFAATGIDLFALKAELDKKEQHDFMVLSSAYIAKEFVLLKTYLDYYEAHSELGNQRLTSMIKTLQHVALAVG